MYTKEEIDAAAKHAGTDVNEIAEFVSDYPEVLQLYGKQDPMSLAKTYAQVMNYSNEGRNYPAPESAAEGPQRIVVQGPQAPRLPFTVDPYAGTTQKADNPDAPNAALISQFDPRALKAAQEEFNRQYQNSQGARTLGNILAGLGSGTSGGRTMEFNDKLKEEQKQAMVDRTIGAQLRQQAQATAGEAALTSAQAREVGAGQFTGTQRAKQIELDLSKLNLDTQKRINDSASAETLTAKAMLSAQLRNMGNTLTKDDLAAIKAVLDRPDVTAQQLLPLMAQYAPAAHKAFLDTLGGKKTEAEAAQARGLAAQAGAEAGRITSATPGVQAESDITRATANTIIDNGKLKENSGYNTSIQAGPASLSPTPLVTGSQELGAKEAAIGRELGKVSNKYRLNELTTSLAQASQLARLAGKQSASSSMANTIANLTPSAAESLRANINALVEGKIAYNEAAGIQGAPKDRDLEVRRIMQLSPDAFQLEVLNLNSQVQRQEARQKLYDEHLKNTGSSLNFDDSSIKNSKYVVNVETGQAGLIHPSKLGEYKKKGFKTLDELGKK